MGRGAIKPPPRPWIASDVDPALRRARIMAARTYAPGSIPRRAILAGYWDHGSVVGRFMTTKRTSDGNEG